MSIIQLIKEELRYRNVQYLHLADFFIASIGAHLFNLVNQVKKVLFDSGRLYNTRLHICFVAPPGYGKSFYLEQFLDPEYGIVSSVIPTCFQSSMTEAGYVGTIKRVDGDYEFIEGVAGRYKYGIIGVEEFSVIGQMMQTTHSKALDTAMLLALDSGRVVKSLAGGEISYETYHTLWAGVQPARYDLSSGMGRRLCFLELLPTISDKMRLKKSRRKGRVRPDVRRLQMIRQRLTRIKLDLQKVEEVVFHDSLYQFLDSLETPHYEDILLEKIALGYTVMMEDWNSKMVVRLTPEIRKLLEYEVMVRRRVHRGPELQHVVLLIQSLGGRVKLKKLRDELSIFGYDWERSTELIIQLKKFKLVDIKGDEVVLK